MTVINLSQKCSASSQNLDSPASWGDASAPAEGANSQAVQWKLGLAATERLRIPTRWGNLSLSQPS